MRRIAIPVCLLLFASVASGGVGVNLYGLTHHLEDGDFNEENWGVGLQYDLIVAERSRLYLDAGGLKDSEANLNLHGGIVYQHRLVGPLWGGGAVFVAGSETYLDGEPLVGALPLLSLVSRPGELTLGYVPGLGIDQDEASLLLYATVFPFGRTEPGLGCGPPPKGSRQGFEFGFHLENGLQELKDVDLVYRRLDARGRGFRLGVAVTAEVGDSSNRSFDLDRSYYDRTRLGITAFWERIRLHGGRRAVRLLSSWGVFLRTSYQEVFRENILEASDLVYADTQEAVGWGVGLRGGLGVEWRLAADLALTAEAGAALAYEREASESINAGNGQMRRHVRRSDAIGFESTSAVLGVVLYYD